MYIFPGKTAGTDGTTAASVTFSDWWAANEQASGDMIFVEVTNDGGGTTLAGMGGWTEIGTQQSNAGCRTAIWYREHSGTEITAPTITGASAEEYSACAVLIRPGAGGTLAIDAQADTQQTANTQDPTAPSVTTTGTNRLLLFFVGRDATGTCLPAAMIGRGQIAAARNDNLTTVTPQSECQIAWTIAPTAGATPTFAWRSTVSDGGRQTTVAVSDSSGHVPAYIAASGVEVVNNWTTAPTVTLLSALHATINGITTAASDTTGGASRNVLTSQDTTNAALGLYGYYRQIGQVQTANTGLGSRMYGAVATIASTNFSNALFYCNYRYVSTTVQSAIQDQGYYLYFRDSAGGWAVVRPIATERLTTLQQFQAHVLYLPGMTQIDGSGTIDWSDIVGFGSCIHITSTNGQNTNREYLFRPLLRIPFTSGYVTVCGGTSSATFGLRSLTEALQSSGYTYNLPATIGSKLNYVSLPVRIGNGGTDPTFFDGNANAFEFVDGAANGVNISADDLEFAVNLGASDVFRLGSSLVGCGTAQKFTIESGSSSSATTDWAGTLFGMTPALNSKGTPGLSFKGCAKINAGSGNMAGCKFLTSIATDAAVTITDGSDLTDAVFTKGAETYAIEIAGNGPQTVTLVGVDLSAYTTAINLLGTTGEITIILGADDDIPTYVSAGATVVFDQPIVSLTVTSNETNTLLQIFTTNTQTVLASTTGTSLVFEHSGQTVDIVAQKAGFLPQRVTGVILSGNMTQAFTMLEDFNYVSTHGLTYTTDASWDRSTNRLIVPNFGPSVINVYSLMIDSFISQSSLRNTAFNLSMNGPLSLFLINDAEGQADADIENMTGGGVRYLSSSDVITEEFVGIASQGVVVGSQVEYVQSAGGTVVDARATGNVNEIIKVYGDASHGNFDYRDYLEFKVQRNGYRQAEASVLDVYGIAELTPSYYLINLAMTEIDGLTLGDPSPTGLSISDDSVSPVSWDAGDGAKNYSITITDAATNSGDTILRWLNYNLSLDATFGGKDPWMWPEMVIDNGLKYETLRGNLHKSPADVIAGVRVIRIGGIPHPDFTRFQSNDGTYGTPPTVSSISITNITAGSRLRIYNVTTATEIFNDIIAGTSYSTTYTEGVGYTTGDVVSVRLAYATTSTAKLGFETSVSVGSSGWSVVANQVNDSVYIGNGIDGNTITGLSIDTVNSHIDINRASGTLNVQDGYAWWVVAQFSEVGIADAWLAFTALDTLNYRNNSTNLFLLDNVHANPLTITGGFYFREDGTNPIATTSNAIWFNTGRAYGINVGGSALTPTESAQLARIHGLIEDSSGDRWTAKSLEAAPTGGGSAPSVTDIWSHATRTLTANPGLTAQEVRDAAKLAPTAGTPAAGSIDAMVDALPTLAEIEASTVLAKEATLTATKAVVDDIALESFATLLNVQSLPTLGQIEDSTVIAKEATVATKPSLAQIEASAVLAKEATAKAAAENAELAAIK
jgi:hypothetical protein